MMKDHRCFLFEFEVIHLNAGVSVAGWDSLAFCSRHGDLNSVWHKAGLLFLFAVFPSSHHGVLL